MIPVEIFSDIKNSFGSLWKIKERGNTLEIITPFATTNDKFVSVFLTMSENSFVISDGGWVHNGLYIDTEFPDDSNFKKVLYHYQNTFNISETKNRAGVLYYYLKVDDKIDIPSAVFDISTFIQSIISTSEVNFEDIKERELKKRFDTNANNFIKSLIPKDKFKMNAFLNPDKKDLKFNVIYTPKKDAIILLNYITGSNLNHFSSSIFKTNALFEMAHDTLISKFITSEIALIDNTAEGFIQDRIAHYISHLERLKNTKSIYWSERENLKSLLN